MVGQTNVSIRSEMKKPNRRARPGHKTQDRDECYDIIILQIMALSESFYCPCSNEEEAVKVMKRYARSGFDSKVIGIKDADTADLELLFGIV